MLRKSKLRDQRGADTASSLHGPHYFLFLVMRHNVGLKIIVPNYYHGSLVSLCLSHTCARAKINISQMRSPNCASDAIVSNIPADRCSASLQDSPACTRSPTDKRCCIQRNRCKYNSVSGCSCRETQMCIYHIRGALFAPQCYEK